MLLHFGYSGVLESLLEFGLDLYILEEPIFEYVRPSHTVEIIDVLVKFTGNDIYTTHIPQNIIQFHPHLQQILGKDPSFRRLTPYPPIHSYGMKGCETNLTGSFASNMQLS